jgi:hypothetical protein
MQRTIVRGLQQQKQTHGRAFSLASATKYSFVCSNDMARLFAQQPAVMTHGNPPSNDETAVNKKKASRLVRLTS